MGYMTIKGQPFSYGLNVFGLVSIYTCLINKAYYLEINVGLTIDEEAAELFNAIFLPRREKV